MSSQLSSRLGCETIGLIAEGGCKNFVVHKNLLITQSPFFRSAIETLSEDGIFDLGSWDGETVGHFVNFLYLQNYIAPNPLPVCPIVGAPEDTASNTTGTRSRISTPGTVRSTCSTQRDNAMDGTHLRPLTPLSGLRDHHSDNNNNGPDHCPSEVGAHRLCSHFCPPETHAYHDVLLAHARVYALAQSLEVKGLSTMAYHRLLGILENLQPITPDSNLRFHVVQLLGYVYAHTQDSEDRMRKLVSQFVALNFTVMQGVKEMKEVMSRGGQLVVDLMPKVCRRVVATEEELDHQREIAKAVTEQLRVERLKVVALEFSNGHVETSVKDMALDMDSALQQLKVDILKVGKRAASRNAMFRQIESLRSKSERFLNDVYPGKPSA